MTEPVCVESIAEVTPVKVTVWSNADGYNLERSDDPGVLYIYATHTPKQFYDAIRHILEG